MGKEFAVWNEQLVEIFCDICIKEVDNNNRPNTHLTKEGFENLIHNFENETGKLYTKKQMKNKWDNLKEQWKLWKDLKGKQTGLGWDHKLQTIDASEDWWHEKIKENKEYGKLRKKGITPDFEAKLDKLFSGVVATGRYACTPGSLPQPSSPVHCYNENDIQENGDSYDTQPTTTQGIRKRSERIEKGKGVAVKKGKVGGAVLLASKIDRMCEAIESRSTTTSIAKGGSSIKDVMKDVISLPGGEPRSPLWFFATDLFVSQEKREIFSTMEDNTMRLAWLEYERNKTK